jgi:uncharacterized PurR-regulated membrane protein YhhQ (DUF165 family)
MESSPVSRKRYFLALAVVFISVIFAALCALGVALGRYGSNTAIMVAIGVAIAVSIWMAMFLRKPSQRANYPRVEHLRIAGKYAPAGASKVGVSPLHLK